MLSKTQKDKLRKLLEGVSTPEEMKSFDMEILSVNNDKIKNEIISEIAKNKPVIDFSFVSKLIEKSEKAIMERISELREKKIPVYDDSDLKNKIDSISNGLKESSVVKEARQKKDSLMIDELINIGDLLLEIKNISNIKTEDTSSSKLDKVNENLEGVGNYLLKILSKTGSNDSFRIKDSSSNIINPATEETQLLVKSAIENITIPAPVGGATEANQTNGLQKIQIVDAGGEAVSVTGGKLDVNSSSPVGGATEAKQDTQIIAEQEIASALYSLRQILSLLADPMFLDPATSRVRVALESAAITMTGITTVSTVTSMTQMGGYPIKDTLLNANEDLVWGSNLRNLIS